MRKSISLLLVVVLMVLLAACSSGEIQEEPGKDIEAAPGLGESAGDFSPPEGLFVYYNWTHSYPKYGLLDGAGNIVLPIEYERVWIVEDLNWQSQGEEPDDRYFAAQRYEFDEEEKLREYLRDDPWGNEEFWAFSQEHARSKVALVSPKGEFLTDFLFTNIFLDRDADKFIGLSYDPFEAVWIEKDGTVRSIDDEERLFRYNEKFNYGEEEIIREGPDVPAGGFHAIVPLPDGRYWGSFQNGDAYAYRLFSAEGEFDSDIKLTSIYHLDSGFYEAHVFDENNEKLEFYLSYGDGTPVIGQIYRMAMTAGDYFILQREKDNRVFVYSLEDFTLKYEWEGTDDFYYSLAEAPGYTLVTHMDSQDKAHIINLETGKELFTGDGNWYVEAVNPTYGTMLTYNDGWNYLMTLEGEILLQSDASMHAVGDYLMVLHNFLSSADRWLNYYSLYRMDGEELLPPEYRNMEVLPGGVLLVQRGDDAGLMTVDGHWIYKESRFESLID